MPDRDARLAAGPAAGGSTVTTATSAAAPVEGTTARRRWPRPSFDLLRPLVIFVASRGLVLLALSVSALLTPPGQDVREGPWPRVGGTGVEVLDGLVRWDGAWYLAVADGGYVPLDDEQNVARNAFFPLYPLLVRLVSVGTGMGLPLAALVVALVGGAASTVAVWMLARRLAGAAAADRATALYAFFPGAFTLSMAYSEPVFIALAAACLLALVSRHWVAAGLLAAAAGAARPTGVALCLACGCAAGQAVLRRREWRALAAPVLSPLGILAFFGVLWRETGEPLAWVVVQRDVWGERVRPGEPVTRALAAWDAITGPLGTPASLNALVPTLFTLVVVVTVVLLVRWRPPGEVMVFALVAVALATFSASIGPRPRMVLDAVPLVIAIGVVARGAAFSAVLGLSAGAMAVLTVLTVASPLIVP